MDDMRTIRVTHYYEDGYGWSFDSPDVPGLVGGPENDAPYEASCRHAESAVRFALEGDADERGEPFVDDIAFRHLVPASA